MRAKDFLLRLKKLDKMIENKISEREMWLSCATSTTGNLAPEIGVRVQSSGNKQKTEDAVLQCIDLERMIDAAIDELYNERRKIVGVIERLDVTEYDVLYKLYVGDMRSGRRHYYTFDEIAELYDRSRSWATTMHGNALRNVQKIVDNCSEL